MAIVLIGPFLLAPRPISFPVSFSFVFFCLLFFLLLLHHNRAVVVHYSLVLNPFLFFSFSFSASIQDLVTICLLFFF